MAWEKKTWLHITGTGLNEFRVDGELKTISAKPKADGTPFTAEAINDLENRLNTAITTNEALVKKTWNESVVADESGDYSIILDGVDAKLHLTFTGASRGLTATIMNGLEDWFADFIAGTIVTPNPPIPSKAVVKTAKINGVKVSMEYAPTSVTQEGDDLLEALADICERLVTYDSSDCLVTVLDEETPVTQQDLIIVKDGETVGEVTTDGDGHADFIDLVAGVYAVSYPDGTHSTNVTVPFNKSVECTVQVHEEVGE